MWNFLKLLQKNLVWSVPAFMALGLIFGWFFDATFLKSWIIPLTFVMVYPMMVTLNVRQLVSKGDAKLQLTALVINFAITPFVGWFIGKLFFPDQPLLVLGLLLTSLLPTSGMTISWTGFAKGNMPAAVKMTVVGLIVGSLATPLYLKGLMGTVVEINLLEVFFQILYIVFLPLLLGWLTQALLIKKAGKETYEKKYKVRFPLFSTLGVLAIVFVSMALKSKAILAEPQVLLYYFLPLLALYLINFLISTLAGKYLFKRADGIALVYGTVMRNLSIALALAMTIFGKQGSEVALIISLAYIIQVQAAAWYVKLTAKLFPENQPVDGTKAEA